MLACLLNCSELTSVWPWIFVNIIVSGAAQNRVMRMVAHHPRDSRPNLSQ